MDDLTCLIDSKIIHLLFPLLFYLYLKEPFCQHCESLNTINQHVVRTRVFDRWMRVSAAEVDTWLV